MITKELRSYEVSLWTLQDEFITVLKWSDVEQDGRIEEPQIKLNIDGTQNFTFSIPMYLYYEISDENSDHIIRLEKQENPIWYNTKNGNLMVGMRKIKVIFNKGTNDEQVFEFIIVKVTESHEQDQLKCNIECEGLAFHELGKIGYKLSLSQDTFILDKKDWDEKGTWTKHDGTITSEEPIENVQYWCEQCGLEAVPQNSNTMNPTKWYYDIQMNWGSFNSSRSSNIVYENEYVSSWTSNLQPNTIESAREKARPISVSESNIYNITQTIAETFEIYCRYEYGYDDNYHIIFKKIIFYNNYMNEDEMISFTYPYGAKKIEREMDSTEITTKMYVRPQDDDSVVSGQITIADCPANKTKEDYILNFDYMYNTGAITQEQYDAIPEFEKAVRALNVELEDLNLEITALEKDYTEQSALAKVYQESKDLDKKQVDYNSGLYNKLTQDGNGYIIRGPVNPHFTYIKTDTNGNYYIKFSDEDKGVDPNYVMVFRVYNSTKQVFRNLIPSTDYTIDLDSNGFASQISLNSNFSASYTTDVNNIEVDTANWTATTVTATNTAQTTDNLIVYLVYKYKPVLYYERVNQVWLKKQKEDEDNYYETLLKLGPKSLNDADYEFSGVYPYQLDDSDLFLIHSSYENATAEEKAAAKNSAYNNGINKRLEDKKTTYNNKIKEKNNLIDKFTHMMGPALREGYWQPENYKDYGDIIDLTNLAFSSYDSTTLTEDSGRGILIGWDNVLFDEEDKMYFEEGILKEKIYYPCIQLNSTLLEKIAGWLSAGERPSLIFNNNYYKTLTNAELNDRQNLEIFTLGGDLRLGFINQKETNYVVPVIFVTGTQKMTDDQILFMIQSGHPRLGVVHTTIESDVASTTFSSDTTNLSVSNFFWDSDKISEITEITDFQDIYPRLKISSNELNTNSIVLKYNDSLLDNYTDYSILSRTNIRDDKAYFEYYITIKPDVFFKVGSYTNLFSITYTLSNAATCIYLDAQEVMSDSSKPKVSYVIDVNVLNEDYLRTTYKDLGQLVMINDTELKFEDVFGYISGIDLNLDAPWEDQFEVKNYKTKFEDLFSTIVAQTEGMKKISDDVEAAINGKVCLSPGTLEATLEHNWNIFQDSFDSGFNSSDVVKRQLTELFTEAGAILNAANDSLSAVRDLNIRNSEILAGFIEKVAEELVPQVATSQTQPTNFKVGDIWNQTDGNGNVIGRYIATTNSSNSTNGYTRTFDGSLAAIKGAKLNIDAVGGKIELLAENQIDMKSGGNIYIAANEKIDIVGNKSVNIGGTQINIGSTTVGNTTVTGGINLVAAAYDAVGNSVNGNSSKVLISPTKIEMGAAELTMKSASIINMYASTGTAANTSTIKIDANNGVWIGSGKSVEIFAGENTTGANVSIGPERLFMGVTNDGGSAAVDIRKGYIILAAGTNDTISAGDITVATSVTSLTGLKLTKESFGLSIGSSTSRSLFLANSNGVIIGTGEDPETDGSFVKISGGGIKIGSQGTLEVNTTNFKVNPNATGTTNLFYVGTTNNYIQYSPTNGLEINGKITATAFTLASGVTIPWDNINTTGASFGQDGLSYTSDWNGTGKAFVTLTSQTGLLIGADNGIVVPSSANAAGLTTPYLKIDNDGIILNGKHIYINGEKEWSRNDIIILKKPGASGYESQDDIETRMSTSHDWVLIKPYYDAFLDFTYNGFLSISGSAIFNLVSDSAAPFFGTTTNYTYELVITFYAPNQQHMQILLYAQKGNDTSTRINVPINFDTLNISDYGDILDETGTSSVAQMTKSNDDYIIIPRVASATMKLTPSAPTTNLCREEYGIYVQIIDTLGSNASDRITISQIKLHCTCNAVTGKVPCTVFYYP